MFHRCDFSRQGKSPGPFSLRRPAAKAAAKAQDIASHEKLTALYNIAMCFVIKGRLDECIRHAIDIFGTYLCADNVRIYGRRHEESAFHCIYHWSSEKTAKDLVFTDLELHSDVYYSLRNHDCSVADNSAPWQPEQKYIANALGAASFACAPIRFSSGLWGFLEWDSAQKQRKWSAEDMNTAMTVINILSAGMERQSMEEDLYTAQETLRVILDNVPSGIYWKDSAFVIQGCNQTFAQQLGLPQQKIIGKRSDELFSKELAAKGLSTDQKVLNRKKPHRELLDLLRMKGPESKIRWARLSKLPIKNEWGEVTHILGIIEDATSDTKQQMRLAQRDKKLVEHKEAAQNASEAKSAFISSMSHEIRTPLNIITGMARIAQESADGERIRHCLDQIRMASDILLNRINTVLDLSKIESGKLELEHMDFCLETAIMDICNVIAVRAREKKLKFNVHIKGDVPGNFLGDAVRIGQILMNILFNSVKYTPENGTVSVGVSLLEKQQQKSVIQFTIADTGIGMSEEMVRRLFEPFEQADSSTARLFGGTGLGMSIVKELVDLMNGQIAVHSVPGEGTEIIVKLELENSASDSRIRLSDALAVRQPRVLIADPNREYRKIYQDMLYGTPAKLYFINNPHGLRKLLSKESFHKKPFDIFLIDFGILDSGNMQFTEDLCKACGPSRLAWTSDTCHTDGLPRQIHEQYARRVISKPLLRSNLYRLINELLCPESREKPGRSVCTGKRILLVEDLEINKEVMCAFLEKLGVIVDWVADGQSALDKFCESKGTYDLILMDIRIPILDGYEATRAIRQAEREWNGHVPIIATTANVFKEDVDECMRAGMDDYIIKPVNKEKALEKIEFFLMRSGTQKKQESDAGIESAGYADFKVGLARLEGKAQLYKKMLVSFIENNHQQELRKLWENNSQDRGLYLHVHMLKGLTGNLALTRLYDQLKAFEEELTSKQATQLAFDELCKCYDETMRYLHDHVVDLVPNSQ